MVIFYGRTLETDHILFHDEELLYACRDVWGDKLKYVS